MAATIYLKTMSKLLIGKVEDPLREGCGWRTFEGGRGVSERFKINMFWLLAMTLFLSCQM